MNRYVEKDPRLPNNKEESESSRDLIELIAKLIARYWLSQARAKEKSLERDRKEGCNSSD